MPTERARRAARRLCPRDRHVDVAAVVSPPAPPVAETLPRTPPPPARPVLMATRQGPPGGGGLWATLSDAPPFPAALESLLAGSLFPDEPSAPGFFGGLSSPPPPLSSAAFLGNPQEMLVASSMQEMLTLPSRTENNVDTESTGVLQGLLGSSIPLERLILPSHTDNNIDTESTGALQGLQNSSIALERPADDGYNWRKYGQKTLKGGDCPRSYYRCSHGHGNCLVRKNVEHSADGRIVQIIYRGQHSHEPPTKRRFRDCAGLSNELDDFKDNEDALYGSQSDFRDCYGKPTMSDGTMASCLMTRREEGDDQLSGSYDSQEENDCEAQTDDGTAGDTDANERNTPAPGQKIIVSTTSEVDLLDDGYRWRKYGQKVVKGNPHPRSYYRCTYQGCDVKKHIERSWQEPYAVITTYEGKHIHDVPVTRNGRHATENTQAYCTDLTYGTITC